MARSAEFTQFGALVERYRKRRGLKTSELAKAIGISRTTMYRQLTGQGEVSDPEIEQYRSALKIPGPEVLAATGADWEPSAVREEGPPYATSELEEFVSNMDRVVRLLSTGEGAKMGPKSKLAIMNGIEEAARLAGQKLPAEFYDLRRRINEGTL